MYKNKETRIKPLNKNFFNPLLSLLGYKNRDLYNWVESSGKDLSKITEMIDKV